MKKQKPDERRELEHRALLIWLKEYGKSLEWLLAEIAEKQPGDNPLDYMGVGPELPSPIIEGCGMTGQWRLLAARGMQHLICNRSWQRPPPAQGDLFA